MDIFKRIAYLHQVQELLNQKQSDFNDNEMKNNSKLKKLVNKPNKNKSIVRLNSFYGYVLKEIAMKHNIQM